MLFFLSSFISFRVFFSCRFLFIRSLLSSVPLSLSLDHSMLALPICSYLAGASQFNSTYLSLSVYLCCCCCCCFSFSFCWCWCGCCSFAFSVVAFFSGEKIRVPFIFAAVTRSTQYICISMCALCIGYDDRKTQAGVNSIHIGNRIFFLYAE